MENVQQRWLQLLLNYHDKGLKLPEFLLYCVISPKLLVPQPVSRKFLDILFPRFLPFLTWPSLRSRVLVVRDGGGEGRMEQTESLQSGH